MFKKLVVYLPSLWLISAVAQAQQSNLEEVIITGTRTAVPRSASESPVPIDVITGEDFVDQGDNDLNSLLRNVVPSYNVNVQPLSDAATIVRPANLRGLAPDHSLVLVNEKRRHRAAVIYWLGNGVSDGAQGPDISPIPAIALKQVEVLRDGAAAQYGSDAIAGIINFLLKDDSSGGRLEVKAGQFYEGDGQSTVVSGNVGLPLTENGFANFSFEIADTQDTDRSVQRTDAAQLIAEGNQAVKTPAQVWGQPRIKDDIKLMANLGLDLDDAKQAYAFGNYATKTVDGGFYFRNPNTRGGVFSRTDEDGTLYRLAADLTPGATPCAVTPVYLPSTTTTDTAGLQALIDDPECFVFNEIFPGGFTPRFGGNVTDISGTAGVRDNDGEGWDWDVSFSAGLNDVDYFIYNTVNASLGPLSPTSFNPGDYTQLDKTFNLEASHAVNVASLAQPMSIAGGFEWRDETFEATGGDQASYEIGPYFIDGLDTASNGFPGFGPLTAGQWSRSNIALFLDSEAYITDNWLLTAALRWEDFQGFGTTTNGKLATNVVVTEFFTARASYSTGFRAPTPGQINAFNVSTQLDQQTGELVNNGTVASTNPLALLQGGEVLEPELSTNFTAGVIFQFDLMDLTIDYFNIKLEDRLALSQDFALTEAEIDTLVQSGVTYAGSLRNFRFFTNDFDTTTSGIDVVATFDFDMLKGDAGVTLSYNHTKTEVDAFTQGTTDETRIRELQEGLPQNRLNLQLNQVWDRWRFMARMSYFDEFFDSEDDQTYGAESLLDIEAGYRVNDRFELIAGTQNTLDEYPDKNPSALGIGNQYSQFSPTGFNGGFYYLKARYSWD